MRLQRCWTGTTGQCGRATTRRKGREPDQRRMKADFSKHFELLDGERKGKGKETFAKIKPVLNSKPNKTARRALWQKASLATSIAERIEKVNLEENAIETKRRSEEHTSELQSQFHLVC